MERKEEREKVLVPVRRKAVTKKELTEEPQEPREVKVPEIPRRYRVY